MRRRNRRFRTRPPVARKPSALAGPDDFSSLPTVLDTTQTSFYNVFRCLAGTTAAITRPRSASAEKGIRIPEHAQRLVEKQQADPDTPLGTTQRYRIVELDNQGRQMPYGPYDLELDGGEVSHETWAAGIDWGNADSSPDADPAGDGLPNMQEYLAGECH